MIENSGIDIWTKEMKDEALEFGAPCCEYYFDCWRDSPPYERGACCRCMKDKTWKDGKWVESLCPGCTDD